MLELSKLMSLNVLKEGISKITEEENKIESSWNNFNKIKESEGKFKKNGQCKSKEIIQILPQM